METFSIDIDAIGTGKLFPDSIENQNWIGYHGTSEHYSNLIESNGFDHKTPISTDQIDFVIDLCEQLSINAENIEGFRDLNSVSFSPISEICLSYLKPSKLGGQGISYIHDTLNEILNSKLEKLSSEEEKRAESLRQKISKIKDSTPIIYAVKLKGLDRAKYDRMTSSVHVYEEISQKRIISKLKIDKEIDFDKIQVKKFKQDLDVIYLKDKNHYINQL